MDKENLKFAGWSIRIISVLLAVIAIFLIGFGVKLISLGGSWFYTFIGFFVMLSAALLFSKKTVGAYLFLLTLIITVIWAFLDSDGSFWAIFSRIFLFLALACLIFFLTPFLKPKSDRGTALKIELPIAVILLIAVTIVFINIFIPHNIINNTSIMTQTKNLPDNKNNNWTHYAGDGLGKRFAPYSQINRENVKDLKVAWTFRTGDIAKDGAEDQNTPLQIDDTVYMCTPQSKVFALDVDTGKEKWSFDPKAKAPYWQRCRSLGYVDLDHNTFKDKSKLAINDQSPSNCSNSRIIVATIDAKAYELDAKTGQQCHDFGEKGSIDLKQGMGNVEAGFYMPTSGPTVIENGIFVIGGWVTDNQKVNEPSGVVRAFDTKTGELVWSWDLGNPNIDKYPPEGETYTKGTPNTWTIPAFDTELGLVYFPMGNTTPDFWGGERNKYDEEFSSSIVAVNYLTGKVKWKYQTVHHDIWDYDLPAQPALYDVVNDKGEKIPALIQLTKRGQIFVVDRRTGEPITKVEEKAVPTDKVAKGDWVSPTQPYSVGMPAIVGDKLSENNMWGMTLLDQLYCRIAFKESNYSGDFTPPYTENTIQFPANGGGMNWGSATIDANRDYLIVNDMRIAMWNKLVPRNQTANYDKYKTQDGHVGLSEMEGTPYALYQNYYLSPLGVPCTQPPLGTITAIDLKTKQIAWQIPLGTTLDSGPLGIKTHLPIPVGMPTLSGSLATNSGLIFFSGTQDYYIRAIDSDTGKIIWKDRLPVGGQSTPMSYISPKTGKQYIVFTASGARGQPDRGDYVIAYALPDKK